MEAFTRGDVCRRVVMDEVMDGRVNCAGCEAGEEICDVCAGEDDARGAGELSCALCAHPLIRHYNAL
ncbi:hypothetical protein CTA1_9843 [Colletotrichum tanaceti]|uniref:Uncharacterized protein n=1 Tax=Colletotrichum tanaceti TaxID=1306861 RepID=A0A4U6XGV5_9PEZI|nr:hypothetical protein CTA1_9843 [Colletotrichum tanaceti]